MVSYVIDKDILSNNVSIVKQLAGTTPIIAVIKYDGFGMGLVPYARFLSYRGIEFFGVATLSEAIELKNAGITGEVILLTSNALVEDAEEIVKNNIIATVGSVESAVALDEAGKKLEITPRAHVEINIGMGRFGFDWENIAWCNELKKLNIDYCGTYAHYRFSSLKDGGDVKTQTEKFKNAIKRLYACGFPTGMLHMSNSQVFLKYPKTHLDGIRIGSAFVGKVADNDSFGLKPVGYFESKVLDTSTIKKGEIIGYSNKFKAKKDLKVAIIPAGYDQEYMFEKTKDSIKIRGAIKDILNYIKPENLYVKIGSENYKVIGRVSTMNVIADITDSSVKVGDSVILPGSPVVVDSGVTKLYKGKDL